MYLNFNDSKQLSIHDIGIIFTYVLYIDFMKLFGRTKIIDRYTQKYKKYIYLKMVTEY